MNQFAICAIFKNEAPHLREWIAYHNSLGVSKFFLYDNGSTDNGALNCIHNSSEITVIPWPVRPGQQAAYQHCIQTFSRSVDWIAFIDVDEFIHPLRSADMMGVVGVARDHSAVLLNWLVFGPGGHAVSPPGPTTKAYNLRLPENDRWNAHVKSVVRSARIEGCTETPHIFQVRGLVCNSRGESIPNVPIQAVACHDRSVINHYYTRSSYDWLQKASRGRATTEDQGLQRTQLMFDYCALHARVRDRRIHRLTARIDSNPRWKSATTCARQYA